MLVRNMQFATPMKSQLSTISTILPSTSTLELSLCHFYMWCRHFADSFWLNLIVMQWKVWTYRKGINCERFPHLFCKVIMRHLYTQKNLVGWRQWKAVMKQKAMLFSTEEWYNPNVHLEEEAKHCFGFMLQYPSFVLFLFSIFTWQNLLLKIMSYTFTHLHPMERAELHGFPLQ